MTTDIIISVTYEELDKFKNNLPVIMQNVGGDRIIFMGDASVKSLLDSDKMFSENCLNFCEIQQLSTISLNSIIETYLKSYESDFFLIWNIAEIPTRQIEFTKDDKFIIYIQNGIVAKHNLLNTELIRNVVEQIYNDNREFNERLNVSYDNDIYLQFLKKFISNYPNGYIKRDWKCFEQMGKYFLPFAVTNSDIDWIGKEYDSVYFDKKHRVIPELCQFFVNEDLRKNLAISQICDVINKETAAKISGDAVIKDSIIDSQITKCEDDRVDSKYEYDEIKNRLIGDVDFVAALGDQLLRVVSVFGPKDRIHISMTSDMQNAIINTMSGHVYIGEETFCGHNVSIITGSHDACMTGKDRKRFPDSGNDIEIGNGVWICSNAVILGPCKICDNSVIAAGSVVLPGTVVGKGQLYAGVPAKYKKDVATKEE